MKHTKDKFKAMLKKIDNFCEKTFEIFMRWFRNNYILLVFGVIFLASFLVRQAFIDYLSGDMSNALLPWFNFLKTNGGFKAMGTYPWNGSGISKPGDYPVSYLNLLALLSYIPGEPIRLIKYSSIFFDYVLAFGVLAIIRLFNKNNFFSLVSFTILVFFPTSILNSSVWGQADQLYVALTVWALYFLIKNHHFVAMILLGFAFATKLQTSFFLPVLVFMWLNKKFKVRHLLVFALAIFITFSPSYLAGAPFKMPFEMYALQIGGLYRNQNYGAGSVYAFFEFGSMTDGINNGAGVITAFIAIGVVILFLYHYKVEASAHNLIYVATLFSVVAPFFLPHMHERYFYMADAFLILYVLFYKRKYHLAFLMVFSSVLTYTHFLMGSYIFKFLETDSVRLAALINLYIMVDLIKDGKNVLTFKKEELDFANESEAIS